MRTRAPARTERPLLGIPELSALIGVNPSTLYRAINRGDFPLPIVRFGNRIQVPRAAAEKMIYGSARPAIPGLSERADGDQHLCAFCSAPLRRPPGCAGGRKLRILDLSGRGLDRRV
jgi:predicted DNA-binding transcriptional regulator AlpA